MARANWASRWAVFRSVLRRSAPKFDSHELVRSTGQRNPIGTLAATVAVTLASGTLRRSRRRRVRGLFGEVRADHPVCRSPDRATDGLDLPETTPPRCTAPAKVGPKSMQSLRFALSAVHDTGMPTRSVRIDHFQPSLARSVGFLPVPSPPAGLLCKEPSTRHFGEVEADDLVVGGHRPPRWRWR